MNSYIINTLFSYARTIWHSDDYDPYDTPDDHTVSAHNQSSMETPEELTCAFNNLTLNVATSIFEKLQLEELRRSTAVCKNWRTLATKTLLWNQLTSSKTYRHFFSSLPDTENPFTSFIASRAFRTKFYSSLPKVQEVYHEEDILYNLTGERGRLLQCSADDHCLKIYSKDDDCSTYHIVFENGVLDLELDSSICLYSMGAHLYAIDPREGLRVTELDTATGAEKAELIVIPKFRGDWLRLGRRCFAALQDGVWMSVDIQTRQVQTFVPSQKIPPYRRSQIIARYLLVDMSTYHAVYDLHNHLNFVTAFAGNEKYTKWLTGTTSTLFALNFEGNIVALDVTITGNEVATYPMHGETVCDVKLGNGLLFVLSEQQLYIYDVLTAKCIRKLELKDHTGNFALQSHKIIYCTKENVIKELDFGGLHQLLA